MPANCRRKVKRKYPRWEDAYRADKRKIAKAIKDAGLSNQKAAHIKQALKKIKADFGSLSLESLKHAGDTEAEGYLMSLPGLGKKAARCIMLYSLGRDVLPVDTHTQRVAERLGLIGKVDNKKAHDLLDRKVPKRLSYIFHVGCVVHGRTICLHNKPKCGECFMSKYCKYSYRKTNSGIAPAN
jgi:endonuclease III